MKLNVLRSIAHNAADSLASGISLLIGSYEIDVFGEARNSPNGQIVVLFLAGVCTEGKVSPALARDIAKCPFGVRRLCVRHKVPFHAFRTLAVRYWSNDLSKQFEVTVEDQQGRRAIDHYEGIPGSRRKLFDSLGRIRRMPTLRIRRTPI